MSVLDIFDNSRISEGIDLSPTGDFSEQSDPDSTDNVTYTEIGSIYSSSGAIVTAEWLSDGNNNKVNFRIIYSSATVYKYGATERLWSDTYIKDLNGYIDGMPLFSWDGVWLTEADSAFYEGAALIEYLLRFDDTIDGSDQKETLYGYDGNDYIYGRGGDDFLSGGPGRDSLYGGNGDDVLFDNSWADNYFSGGPGTDTVLLSGKAEDYILSRSANGEISAYWESGWRLGIIASDIENIEFTNGGTVPTSDLRYLGQASNLNNSSPHSVYRFYNARNDAFFYTSSAIEKDIVLDRSNYEQSDAQEWPYIYQGSSFAAAHSYNDSTPLYRFYNHITGHHFFTASESEKNLVIEKAASGEWPFNYEGEAFGVYTSDPNPNSNGQEIAVHRFYSSELNRHFFTANENEVAEIQLTGQWLYEGIGFWAESVAKRSYLC